MIDGGRKLAHDVPSLFAITTGGGLHHDHTHSISAAELRAAMERLGLGLQPKQLDELLASAGRER